MNRAPAGPPLHSYLVCFTARSGSTLLCDALSRRGCAGRPAEYFNPSIRESLAHWWRVTDSRGYVTRALTAGATPNRIFGAKVSWSHFGLLLDAARELGGDRQTVDRDDDTVLRSLLPDLRYIHMTRRDKVRQAISFYRARQTDIWLVPRGGFIGPIRPPPFDFEAIDGLVHVLESDDDAWRDYFARHDITPLTVTYEELVPHLEGTADRVLEWLGIPRATVTNRSMPRLERQADGLTEDWVCRYQEEKLAAPAAGT